MIENFQPEIFFKNYMNWLQVAGCPVGQMIGNRSPVTRSQRSELRLRTSCSGSLDEKVKGAGNKAPGSGFKGAI